MLNLSNDNSWLKNFPKVVDGKAISDFTQAVFPAYSGHSDVQIGSPERVFEVFKELIHKGKQREIIIANNILKPIIESIDISSSESFPIEVFSNPPKETKLDHISTFCILGFDFKIDVHNQIKIIEVNGMNSGMKGFAQSGIDAEIQDLSIQRADKLLMRYLRSYGQEQLAMLGTELLVEGSPSYRLPIIKEYFEQKIFDMLGKDYLEARFRIHDDWITRYSEVTKNLCSLETRLEDKMTISSLLNDGDLKPDTYECSSGNFRKLYSKYKPDFIVAKPRYGCGGKDIVIASSREFRVKDLDRYNEDFILEPFIKSTEIYSSHTEKTHDGCMRYIVLVEQYRDSENPKIHHFGGYWRLCPLPIDQYGHIDAMRANLSKEALHAKCADQHLDLARNAVENVIKDIWSPLRFCSEA